MLVNMSGLGFTDASGSIAATTVGGGRAGKFARVKVVPVNPKTIKQISQHSKFSTRNSAWRGLTQAQQDAWIGAAASGEWPQKTRLAKTYNPTGPQLYAKLNLIIVQAGGTAIATPPTKVALTAVLLGALTAAAGTPALSQVFSGVLTATERLLIYATGSLSPGKNRPGNSDYRFIVAYSSTTPANLLTAYQAVYGNPVEAQKIFVKAILVENTTGQSAEAGSSVAVVAA